MKFQSQVAIKYIWIEKSRDLLLTFDYIERLIGANSAPLAKHHSVCARFADRSKLMIKSSFFSYIVMISFFFVSGMFELWNSGGHRQIFLIYIPGVYVDSPLGIGLLTALNALHTVMGFLCVSPNDVILFYAFSNVLLVSTVKCREINETSAHLKKEILGESQEIRRRFIEYVDLQREYNEYIRRLDRCFNATCVTFFAATIATGIFAISVIPSVGLEWNFYYFRINF